MARCGELASGIAGALALVTAACGGGQQSGAMNPTPTTCPAGRTLLDGVCVSESVADYVACVRAQGASLGGSKAQKISAEAGTLGVQAGGAAEVSESLERKYSVSDRATLEVIRGCREQGAASPGKPTASSGKTYAFEDANHWSDTLATFYNQTDPQECARTCDDRKDCKVATFCDATCPNGWANTCVLRTKAVAVSDLHGHRADEYVTPSSVRTA